MALWLQLIVKKKGMYWSVQSMVLFQTAKSTYQEYLLRWMTTVFWNFCKQRSLAQVCTIKNLKFVNVTMKYEQKLQNIHIEIEILLKKTKNYWYHLQFINSWQYTYIRWFRIFQTSRYQGIVKATVSGVFKDLKFKISEGSDQNWSCLDSALLAVSAKLRQPTRQSQDNSNFGPSLLKF